LSNLQISKTAVITGASSGIGEALARQLSSEGYAVGLIARREDRLTALSAEIQAKGGKAMSAVADVRSASAVRAAVTAIRDGLGPVGVGMPTMLDPVNLSDVTDMVQVNILGMIYSFAAVLPEMLARRRGHLAVVSSLAAFHGLPGESTYCATKAAANTYAEGLRIQLRGRGIKVTSLCPGFVRTAMTAPNQFHMPWLLEPDDAARRMTRALRRGHTMYRFPWQTSLLMRSLNWLPDWIIARAMRQYNDDPPFVAPPN
jgi:short-subunit dehydrogenase